MRAVPDLLVGLHADSDVVADRENNHADVRTHIQAAGSRAHVPNTRQKLTRISIAPALCRQRNLIERCFNRLKHFRRRGSAAGRQVDPRSPARAVAFRLLG